MTRIFSALISAIVLFAATMHIAIASSEEVSASGTAAQPFKLLGATVRQFHSDKVGIDYKLYVGLPRDYDSGKADYPLLIVLDADTTFAVMHKLTYFLADHEELRPLILVGVAYPGVDEEKYGPTHKLNRTRDYTPTKVFDGGYGKEFQRHSGGADKFLDFVSFELLPFLSKSYRIKPDDRAIMGYSYSGLLSTYAMLKRKDLFQRFLVISPSLWYDKHMILSLERKYLAANSDLRARAFFSVGGLETAHDGQKEMVGDLKSFVANLQRKKFPHFRSQLWIVPDETHHSVFPAAAMRGLRWIYSANP